MIDSLFRDLRLAIRANLRDKGFASTVMLTLAVCIAANALTFAVVNSVLLRPLPVAEADSIVLMSNRYPKAGVTDSNQSGVGDFVDRIREVSGLADQALFRDRNQTLDLNGVPQRTPGMAVTPSFFSLVRTRPALGRAFTAEEGELGAERKVILSDGLWQQLYAGRRDAIGQDLRLNGRPYTIVGVMPPNFNFVNPEARLWIPLAFPAAEKLQHHSNNFYNVGRLKPGVTIAQVQAQVDALNRANIEREPMMKDALINAGFHTKVEPLRHMLVRDVEGVLYLLWSAALMVLLIGGLNVTNLALARLASRRREVATRLALGATRWQLARQSVLESVLISGVGGVLGLAVAYWLLPALSAMGLNHFPRAGEVRVDVLVALISLGLAVMVGVVMGLLPVANLFSSSLSNTLRDDNRTGTSGTQTRRLRQALVAAEVGFAFVLLVGAGLLLASFRNLMKVDPGFSLDGVLTASTAAPGIRYPGNPELRQLMDRTLDGLKQLPGVAAVGATNVLPLTGVANDSVILAEGYVMKPSESVISPLQSRVTPDYFTAMNMPIVRGRNFSERDNEKAEPVVIVDEQLARHFWPNRDPIGQRMYNINDPSKLTPDKNTRWLRVVGVVRSIRLKDLAAGHGVGAYYFPLAQDPSSNFTVVIKSRSGSPDLTNALRAAVGRIDPQLALFDIHSMTERAELSLASRRTSMTLALAFGALALFLSAVGIYGVLAYLVTQRRREIGIRVALGSTGAGVVKLVLREGLALVAGGLAVGLVGAVAMQKAVANEIYGVQPLDPKVLALVVATLAAIGLSACVVPARLALRVDPAIVLTE
jgi:predicted permease